jgi:hypothetical protein
MAIDTFQNPRLGFGSRNGPNLGESSRDFCSGFGTLRGYSEPNLDMSPPIEPYPGTPPL